MKSGKTRILAVILIVALAFSLFAVPAVSAEEAKGEDKDSAGKPASGIMLSGEYERYLNSISEYENAKEDIVIDVNDYSATDHEYQTENGKVSVLSKESKDVLTDPVSQKKESMECLIWGDNDKSKQQGTITYKVNVPEDGIYNIAFTYLPLNKKNTNSKNDDLSVSTNPIEIGLLVDGKNLYAGIDGLQLPRMFVNNGSSFEKPEGTIREDSLKNQLTPEQVPYGEFVTKYACDPTGVVSDPYKVLLKAGEHKLTIKSVYEPFALASIILKAPDNVISYEEYNNANADVTDYAGTPIEIEGENAWLKSKNSLVSKSDNGSSNITPNSPVASILNYIGNTNWQVPGESISWIVNAPEDGLYTLGMNYKQAIVIDGFTYRMLEIDNKIPFEECKNLRFEYCTKWQFKEIGGEDPYKFYLTKGKHVLTLTATLGETAEFYTRLGEIVDVIGDTYIDIVMITGNAPDPNRDYELFRQIPNFQETLLSCYDDLKELTKDMKSLSGNRSNKYISALNNMARVLKNMYDNQYTAQTYLNDFYSNYTTVSSWLYEMKTMPLSLDQIQIAPPEKGFKDNSTNFWQNLLFGAKRFFASFSDDFTSIGGSVGAEDKGNVRIWVNWGRDQAQVLSNLIMDSFTSETGIGVKLEIVNASLIMGLLSGNFPDLSLHVSRTEPVNLGMRGALYDLTNFSHEKDPKYSTVDDGSTYLLDYETVLKRFQDSADKPYWYQDKLFALPDTQSFFIMYYRTDIFNNLGLEDPKLANGGKGWTWSDFLNASTMLQRSNLDAYVPYTKIASTTTVNAGMGSLNLFPTMLTQNNVPLYDDAKTKTTLMSSEAISAFTFWTDLYTKYGIEKQIDFYNRFRVGSAPLGIAPYTTYTQLTQAAPEIQGRWSIAEIPGFMDENGNINRSIAGSGTGCGVIKGSKNIEQAWQFLCWWTSAKTQLRYNNNVESILGAVSRTATANVDAFMSYSWNADDLDILRSQWDLVEELPELPGGYYVSRAVDQAYWQVLNNENNEKDAMLEWGEVANNEIARKIAEYSK